VARIVLGGSVQYATVNADNPHVRPVAVLANECDEHVAILAGIAAEFLFYPIETKVGHWGAEDWERALLWSKDELADAATRAKQLVREHSKAIEAVAAELRIKGRLTGEQVRQIVQECEPNMAEKTVVDAQTFWGEASGKPQTIESAKDFVTKQSAGKPTVGGKEPLQVPEAARGVGKKAK
jgi:hypothetical protein